MFGIGSLLKRLTSRQVSSTTVGIHDGRPMVPPFSERAALAMFQSWVSAAVSLNANAVASVPLRLYVRDRRSTRKGMWAVREVPRMRKRYLMGDARRAPHRNVVVKAAEMGSEFVEVVDHPVLQLLYRVNPWQCGFELMSMLATHMDLTGNAYMVMTDDRGGVPQSIWLLPPECVFVVPGRETWIDGYEYRPRGGTEAMRLDPEDVAHFKLPNPRSQFYGMGGVERMWWSIQANRAAVEQDFRLYENGARPDYAIIVKNAAADADAMDRYTDRINKALRGVEKRGRPWTMTGDVDIRPLNFNPKDMTGRDDLVEEIAAAFAVPVTLLKGNDPNRANAEVGYASWREMAIAPRCRMIEDVLNQNLLPRFDVGDDAVLAFDDPVPDNVERESVVLDRYLRVGAKTLNDAREELGEEPYDNELADQPLFNGQPLGASQPPNPLGMAVVGAGAPAAGPKPDEERKPRDLVGTAGDPNAAVQDTALNGAQVQSLVEIIVQTREGVIPVASAQAMAGAAFPLMTPEQLSGIFGPVASAPPMPKPDTATTTPNNSKSIDHDYIVNELMARFTTSGLLSKASECRHAHAKAVSHRAMMLKADGLGDADDTERDGESERMIREFIASLDSTLREQATAIVEAMRKAGGTPSQILTAVQQEIAARKWTDRIAAAAEPYVRRAFSQGGAVGAARIEAEAPSFDFANPEVQRHVDRATTRIATGVNETTQIRVSALLGRGLEEGRTIDELARGVQEATGVDGARAEMIARTESAKAYVQGQIASWGESGVVVGKRWLLAPDACEFCRAMSRETNDASIPLGEPFRRMGQTVEGVAGGTLQLDYEDIDGPPLHPGCRCDVIPVLEGQQ